MYTCSDCGQTTSGAPAQLMRHKGICTCIRCEECGIVIGDEMESNAWNTAQQREHKRLSCGK